MCFWHHADLIRGLIALNWREFVRQWAAQGVNVDHDGLEAAQVYDTREVLPDRSERIQRYHFGTLNKVTQELRGATHLVDPRLSKQADMARQLLAKQDRLHVYHGGGCHADAVFIAEVGISGNIFFVCLLLLLPLLVLLPL